MIFDSAIRAPLCGLTTFLFGIPAALASEPGALQKYVSAPDEHFSWKIVEQKQENGFTFARLELTSQEWRGHRWTHSLNILKPAELRNPESALLFITGNGDGLRYTSTLQLLAERAGSIAAVLTRVPNQPLFDGLTEDALIAFTFENYLKSGDESWPLLFPMVKSATSAMDAIQAFGTAELDQEITRFVLTGASKRGWTTWLAAAADDRVAAIAPMVIDTLNFKAQLDWAEKMYGKPSEEISDYTNRRLHMRMDDPAMVRLRSWVDPYSYRQQYTLPKLILLGTNDPYWVVDSLRHYWDTLPEPKLLFQTPNAGHNLGDAAQASQTLAAFYQMIADEEPLPSFTWAVDYAEGHAKIAATIDQPAIAIRLWTAHSKDRDFRNDHWTASELPVQQGSTRATATIPMPDSGFTAFLLEAELKSSTGHTYKLSTEARVVPDLVSTHP